MHNTHLIQICLISVVLFLIVNYIISSSHDKAVVDELINRKDFINNPDIRDMSDEDLEILKAKEFSEMNLIKDKYMNEKFRIYVTRGIVFGIGFYFILGYFMNNYINGSENIMIKTATTQMIPDSGSITQQQPCIYFEKPPW